MSKSPPVSTNAWVYDPDHDIVIVENNIVVSVYTFVTIESVTYGGTGLLIQVPAGTVYTDYLYDPITGTFSAPPPPPVYRVYEAIAALEKSDVTLLRCIEHGVTIPTEWISYRASLRPIAGGVTPFQVLPARPDYPVGS